MAGPKKVFAPCENTQGAELISNPFPEKRKGVLLYTKMHINIT
jgi:hypothetical protein